MPNYKPKSCRHCGQAFVPWNPMARWCSLRCAILSRTVVIPNGCWLWTGKPNSTGYGSINWKGTEIKAHRAAHKVWAGPIPNSLYVCHTCDNPLCVNPSHLWLGTHADNMADMHAKGRGVAHEGEKCGKSKLTESQVIEILESNETLVTLGKRYGVSHAAISLIRRGKNWKYLSRR